MHTHKQKQHLLCSSSWCKEVCKALGQLHLIFYVVMMVRLVSGSKANLIKQWYSVHYQVNTTSKTCGLGGGEDILCHTFSFRLNCTHKATRELTQLWSEPGKFPSTADATFVCHLGYSNKLTSQSSFSCWIEHKGHIVVIYKYFLSSLNNSQHPEKQPWWLAWVSKLSEKPKGKKNLSLNLFQIFNFVLIVAWVPRWFVCNCFSLQSGSNTHLFSS